jgi:hypothetical protein
MADITFKRKEGNRHISVLQSSQVVAALPSARRTSEGGVKRVKRWEVDFVMSREVEPGFCYV